MTYGVSEAIVSRIFRSVDDCLIHSKKFNLPKKLPAGGGLDWDVVIVDVAEIVVQHLKKQKKSYIGIEHVFSVLKTFRILSERYRNRSKRLGLRFNLIAGIYNLELNEK